MPDLGLSVQVSRTLLGLSTLEINDHVNYRVADQFLGGGVSWQRTQISSPWIDGAVTTNRTRQMVTEPVHVEVNATTDGGLQTALSTLIDAFNQDNFSMLIVINSTTSYEYACEAADYTIAWGGPRVISKQLQIQFQVPRQPVPLLGGV